MVSISKRLRELQKLLNVRIGRGAAVFPRSVTRIHLDFGFRLDSNRHYGARKVWRNILPRLKYHNPAIPMTVNRNPESCPAILSIYVNKNAEKEDPDNLLLTANAGSGISDLEFADAQDSTDKGMDATDSATPKISEKAKSIYHVVTSALLRDPTPKFHIGLGAPAPQLNERIIQIQMTEKQEPEIWNELLTVTKAREVEPTPGELEAMASLNEHAKRSEIASETHRQVREKIKQEQEKLRMASQAFNPDTLAEA